MTTLEPFMPIAPSTERRTTLADRINSGERYALAFGGQGMAWLEPFADLIRDFALENEMSTLLTGADALVAPVADQLARVDAPFTPVTWANQLAIAVSADDIDAPDLPAADVLGSAAVSVPGILLTQLAALRALVRQGIDPAVTAPAAIISHSQGRLARASVEGVDDVQLLALARLIGTAATVVARRRNLLGNAMLSINNVTPESIRDIVAAMPESAVAFVGVRNARRTVVVSGSPTSLAALQARCEDVAAADKAELARKVRGGSAFAPVFEYLDSEVAFHHPLMADAADLVAEWAAVCGLDTELARSLTLESIVDPVDWVNALDGAVDAGASWLLDLGPADLISRMSARTIRGRGAVAIATATRRGHRELTSAGAAPKRKQAWSSYAPKLIALPDGGLHVETRFTRLTGRSPILLAGMTPTTVDAKIVAAAANAGFWSELAGGGQVTEEIFADRVAELDDLLEPGRSYQFNSLFLDPYLWKLQLGQKRLVQNARANGAAIDGVIVTAGIPELDDAVALVAELREVGISHVVFKPGTVKQIKAVVQIAKEVAPSPIIVQIEGGKAGGHHSWEDLDELLIAAYSDLRDCDNVVVCVGGGIGTPEAASSYLTGSWALKHGYPVMPLDGILVGTAAMATLEATTAPEVKQLLVDTRGTNTWIGAGAAKGGMASNRSQLGADIHEIDNTASQVGRLLDVVAGDAEAVQARRDEIITAVNGTAKPYFGDVAEMTYATWLRRFVELAAPVSSNGSPWLDVTQRTRFHNMLQQAEARLNAADNGQISTLFAGPESVDNGSAALAELLAAYPHAETIVLHPADVPFFLEQCRLPGKPVNFVPVIDGDVRRWWRSDSLWQAHDPRYSADQVCIIPGPVSVAGITRINEPIAELLQRFEDETIDGLLAAGDAPLSVPGRRRVASAGRELALVLASTDVIWAGRTVRNPIHRLGDDWVIVDDVTAENPETGASLAVTDANIAVLTVPLAAAPSAAASSRDVLTLTIEIDDSVALGSAPVITIEAATEAMTALLTGAAGGTLPSVESGVASLSADWNPDLIADHVGVTISRGTDRPRNAVPDVLVGLSWPAVFAALGDTVVDGTPVVEGMLDLVHLDHAIALSAPLPSNATTLTIDAHVDSVAESTMGRIITIDVSVADGTTPVATLTERFAIRGRNGAAKLDDPKRAGGAADADLIDTPRRRRASASVVAPTDMRAFAQVSGDHNPIHTSIAAARLAGLGDPIAHGMWLSAAAQQIVADRRIIGWTTRFLAPLAPGSSVDLRAERVAVVNGDEIIELTARANGELVMAASARLEAPRTVYAFPGQGIQHKGMGMAGYARSKAARDIWDRADAHTRAVLGFSILTVVRDNPTVLKANGVTHRHPDGVLFLTQFTQAAMATLGAAQMAELRESGNFAEGSILAGHSVGEYNALAAVSGVIPLEAVVEVVFQRGSVMHTLVPRDAKGRSNYRLAAIRPSQLGLDDDAVMPFVADVAEQSGEFLEIVNFNLRGSQYAIAGTVAGLEALEVAVNKARDAFGGRAAFVLVPGIDVPFHSTVLRGGVPEFRQRLEDLLPAEIDPAILTGRYIPNLVPKPFSLDQAFVQEIADLVPSEPLNAVLADFVGWSQRPAELCRTLLIELLAWQFASPVRWIETQDMMFGSDLGVERFIEIGVGQAPTVANLASSTLKLPGFDADSVQVLNIERESAIVFSTDEDPVAQDVAPVDEAPATSAPAAAPAAAAPVAASGAPRPADLGFDAADATQILIAMWTKLRIDQIGSADSIESLCDGVSSRRNQLLVDLGGELSLGAIDGAAEADMPTLATTVNRLGRGYKPFGHVLTEAIADVLRKVLGPTGRRQASIAERVNDVWQLGPGWANHVTAELAMATREGASVRGGAFGDLTIAGGADVDAAIDAAVAAVGARHGVQVAMPAAAGGDATVDAAALAEITGQITGTDGVLASTARHLLAELGLNTPAPTVEVDDADANVLERVAAELGSDWARLTAPAFDAKRAVLLDDRWATAREDLARMWAGDDVTASFTAAGKAVAMQAQWWAGRARSEKRAGLVERFEAIAVAAVETESGEWSDDLAVVTGASKGSIAAEIVAKLLGGGATVIATTSRLDHERLAFYRSLYRDNARAGAALWVVPANMASFSDVDALAEWVGNEQSESLGGQKSVVKDAMTPTLLFPFAAGRVAGDMTDAGARSEVDMRILLWSVERLIGALAEHGQDIDIDAVLHVVLPGSPNRGMFGGDGAYGEAKAALDAIVAKWSAESSWQDRVSLAHAIIGWVKGTGLMGQNDPLVDAVEAAGVRTWTTTEMAANLLSACSVDARISAQHAPLTVDFTGGLGGTKLDLQALAADVELPAVEDAVDLAAELAGLIAALPASPAQLHTSEPLAWDDIDVAPEDLVVIVGTGEVGPYGSARTRFEMEVSDELSAAGVLELAWTTGLVTWENEPRAGWYDAESGDFVPESAIADRYHDTVVEACGIRTYVDSGSMVDNAFPLLTSVYLDKDLTFTVTSESEAQALREADPEHTLIEPGTDGDWAVTRKSGTEIRVPRRMKLTRTVGGQIPTGFDPTVWGIPADMADALDRVALWNLIATVDAFLSSGFSPAELMRWVHPAQVANTQGTGMGGMESMHSLYINTLLGESKPNDLLQEALPNVIAAHVMQSYVGGYGAMVHPVAACATTAVSVEEGVDKIKLGKADVVVAGGFDDLGVEGIVGFADMSATADSGAMRAKGIEDRYFSRANDRRRGGFVESEGGGTILLARGDVAARMGLPVLGVVAWAGSFADGIHTSIPAPGIGALSAARGGPESQLAKSLTKLGITADDISVVSKHDTSTNANDPNESELHERLAGALGRSDGNPLFVVSQKSLTGHTKGGAAAFQLIGLCQVLDGGIIPPNRALDCVDEVLAENDHLVWLRSPLAQPGLKAGILTSLGFGHVSGLIAVVHPQAFVESLSTAERESYLARAQQRRIDGRMRLTQAMCGGKTMYERPADRRLGSDGVRAREAAMLLDPNARLDVDGVYQGAACS